MKAPSFTQLSFTVITAAAMSLSAYAAVGSPQAASVAPIAEEALILPSEYNAVLHARAGRWQVFDVRGSQLELQATGCPSNVLLPKGLWLLTRNEAGSPILLAPSSTPLPSGHSGQIALRECGSGQDDRSADASLQIPSALIATLEQNGSAILITQ